jgi:hypothetical protein
MTAVSLEVLTNRKAVDETFPRSRPPREKKEMRVMSTPTTVKFRIAVSSNGENGLTTEKTYFVEMSLSVESESGEPVSIRLQPVSLSQLEGSDMEPQPADAVPPPADPPKTQEMTSQDAN